MVELCFSLGSVLRAYQEMDRQNLAGMVTIRPIASTILQQVCSKAGALYKEPGGALSVNEHLIMFTAVELQCTKK